MEIVGLERDEGGDNWYFTPLQLLDDAEERDPEEKPPLKGCL